MNIQELKLKSSEQLITQAEDNISDRRPSSGLRDVYKSQALGINEDFIKAMSELIIKKNEYKRCLL